MYDSCFYFLQKILAQGPVQISQQILLNELEFEGPLSLTKDFPTQPLTGLQMAPILVLLGLR